MDYLATIFQKILLSLPENNRIERIWLLAKTDFKKRYYGSFLGLIWALINPIFQLFIYYYVFTVIFKSKTESFVLFLFLGLVFWMFFAESSKKSIALIKGKRYLLENIQINQVDIYYSTLLSTLMGFFFNLTAYLVISLLFTTQQSWEIIFFPLLIINLVIFTLSVQVILSIINIFFRDIKHLWDLTLMMLFWMSGILFQINPEGTWKTAILAYLTPIFGIVANARNMLIYGENIDWTLFTYDFLYSFVLLGIAGILMKKYFHRALEML